VQPLSIEISQLYFSFQPELINLAYVWKLIRKQDVTSSGRLQRFENFCLRSAIKHALLKAPHEFHDRVKGMPSHDSRAHAHPVQEENKKEGQQVCAMWTCLAVSRVILSVFLPVKSTCNRFCFPTTLIK
jgi:hypothetical protein